MARTLSYCLTLLAALALTACSGSLSTASNSSGTKPSSKTIVILGSSTAVGDGASPITKGWAYLYTAYAQGIDPGITVVNLAVGGYTTYNILPTGTTVASNRPAVDTAKNITTALTYSPCAILINLPVNDTSGGFSDAETIANYRLIEAAASKQNVPLWVTTTRPANFSEAQRQQLIRIRDWTYEEFGSKAIDDWTTFANDDGTLNSAYAASDNFHFNNAGHALLYQRFVDAKILKSVGFNE